MLSSFKLFLELSNTLPSELIIESLIKILYHTQKDNAEIIIDCLIQYDSLKNDVSSFNFCIFFFKKKKKLINLNI